MRPFISQFVDHCDALAQDLEFPDHEALKAECPAIAAHHERRAHRAVRSDRVARQLAEHQARLNARQISRYLHWSKAAMHLDFTTSDPLVPEARMKPANITTEYASEMAELTEFFADVPTGEMGERAVLLTKFRYHDEFGRGYTHTRRLTLPNGDTVEIRLTHQHDCTEHRYPRAPKWSANADELICPPECTSRRPHSWTVWVLSFHGYRREGRWTVPILRPLIFRTFRAEADAEDLHQRMVNAVMNDRMNRPHPDGDPHPYEWEPGMPTTWDTRDWKLLNLDTGDVTMVRR